MTDKERQLKRLALIVSHPKYFMKYACYTKDGSHSETCRQFPYHIPYHQALIDLWFHRNKMIITKSRQMQVTWVMLGLHLWLAMTGSDREIYLRRTKEADAFKLVDDMKYIYDNIPEAMWPKELKPKMIATAGKLYFPGLNTFVQGVAAGGDQLRGRTPTAILLDEFAFEENDEAVYNTIKPALQAVASKITAVSTTKKLKPGEDPYHRQIEEDRLKVGVPKKLSAHDKKLLESIPKVEQDFDRFPFVTISHNTGFTNIHLHYTADPAKRSSAWKEETFSGMEKRAILAEFEMSWEATAGTPVFGGEYNPRIHRLKERYYPDPHKWPFIIRGWDFMHNHSVALVHLHKGRFVVFDEMPNMGYNTRRIGSEVIEYCNQEYGNNFEYIDVVDPSGQWLERGATGKSSVDILKGAPADGGFGLNVKPGIQDPQIRIDSLMRYLTSMVGGEPAFALSPNCTYIETALVSGFIWPEKSKGKRAAPEKNEYSHIMDALCYIATIAHKVDKINRRMSFAGKRGASVYKFNR